ncbi:MAG: hypothetical protein KTR25_18970 [Myxococcales bacterium]|nr:hypothetical protein [Myxococcales bacterium]
MAKTTRNTPIFPVLTRLALNIGEQVTGYGTVQCQMEGFTQQQPYDASMTSMSQFGMVPVGELAVVSGVGASPLSLSSLSISVTENHRIRPVSECVTIS